MPPAVDTDGSEDVNDFLKRIKELGDERDREDEERTRKLEEEIIQGRRERQARRAERARSLSPTKDVSTHPNTPGSALPSREKSMMDPLSKTPSLPPPSVTPISAMDHTRQKIFPPDSEQSPQGDLILSSELQNSRADYGNVSATSPSAAIAPLRSNPLSWQQRPTSRGSVTGSARSRPSSAVASEEIASRSPQLDAGLARSEVEDNVSKGRIAQSLGAKDPTFFRQTQDRGMGSAAYRKNQVEDTDNSIPTGRSMRLPGMSKENVTEPEDRTGFSQPSRSTNTKPQDYSVQGSTDSSDQSRDHTSVSSRDSHRLLPSSFHHQDFDPSQTDGTQASGDESASARRVIAMSPSQGRLSPERRDRPASPTKGLGGFVQSAMMKRSESVNKRWSAQAGPGLSRGNSVTTLGNNDGVRFPIGGFIPVTNSRQSSTIETTPSVSSRPTSSQSNLKSIQSSVDEEKPNPGINLEREQAELPRKTSGSVSNAEKVSSPPPIVPAPGQSVTSPVSSPNKRWSPTKSSWLGNAISKPESPKVLSPALSQQPAWMADLNRKKQQRGSVDLGSGSTFDNVATGALVRSTPPGVGLKMPSLGALSGNPKPDLTAKSPTGELGSERQHVRGQPAGLTDALAESSATQKPSATSCEAPKSPPTGSRPLRVEPSPVSYKPKPETPPKKDFRTNLKPSVSGPAKGKDEPEFKNVFGKLKKTQTQNYVAPDELKENIMRGKTGLARTGGPQKSIIRDDFKESILKKKEGMVLPTASTQLTSASSKDPDTSTPEAIAKRRALGRSDSNAGSRSESSVGDIKPAPKPEALFKLQSLQEKPQPIASSEPVKVQKARDPPNPGVGGGFASSLAGILPRGPPAAGPGANRSQGPKDADPFVGPASTRAGSISEPATGPELTHATKGRARGPKRKLPSAMSREATTTPDVDHVEPQPEPNLAKDRPSRTNSPQRAIDAQGSGKERIPTFADSGSNTQKLMHSSTPQQSSASGDKKASPLPIVQASMSGSPLRSTPLKSMTPMTSSQTVSEVQGLNRTKTQEPNTKHKDLDLRKVVSDTSSDATLAGEGERQTPQPASPSVKGMGSVWSQSPKSSQPALPRSPIKLPTKLDEEAAMADAGLRPKDVVGLGIEIQPQTTPNSERTAGIASNKSPRSPPLPEKKPIKLQPKSEETIVPNTTRQPVAATPELQRESTAASSKSPKSPPAPGRKPATVDTKISAPPLPTPASSRRNTSPFKEPSESARFFADILDEVPGKSKVNVDTQAVFDKAPSGGSEKIKTLRKQILEITDNGKSEPVPSDQEHILFDHSLYICTHVFGTSTGARKTEVYLWCGDEVSSSAVEDAQLFARRAAKNSDGKLLLVRQGKEPSNFFQALGGIVITRRGSSSRSDSATYMLCGRRHLGQIAFDEVEFSPQSLCVGFPYIISARGGRLYLWKGNGASADELGCARLIGMDLGLTGEIEEIDVGEETDDFWSSFPTTTSKSATAPSQGKFWHLKPTCEKYANKLLEIDVEYSRPKSSSGFMSWGRRGSAAANDGSSTLEAKVREVTPYSQADLVEDGVFVLDAFFELFVIFRLRTSLHPAPQHRSTKSSCLRAALLFAQDYGILAASVEDRPFVPQSHVVILSKPEGSPKAASIPEGMRTCFRKWAGDGIGQEDVQILSLAEALAAEDS